MLTIAIMIHHWDKIIHHKTEDETEPKRKKLYELDAYLMISLHSPAACHTFDTVDAPPCGGRVPVPYLLSLKH